MSTVAEMRRIPLRRLLTKLTALALSAAPVASTAAPSEPLRARAEDDADLDDTPIDREHVERNQAVALLGRSVAMLLAELTPLDAVHHATGWALSEDPLRRGAIARALEWTFPLLGDWVILDHLSRDPDPVTRAACARAAWIRRRTGGDAGVLDRLAQDSDLEVRSIALRARRG